MTDLSRDEHLRRVREVLDNAEGEALLADALHGHDPEVRAGIGRFRRWMDTLRRFADATEDEAR